MLDVTSASSFDIVYQACKSGDPRTTFDPF